MSLTAIDRLARRQHGLVTRPQLLAAGLTRHEVDGWLVRNRAVPIHPTVYRLAGVPESWHQRQLAAVLATPDGVTSHRAAAYLWGLLPEVDVVELTTPYARSPELVGVTRHRSLDVHKATVVTRDGIPTTNPLRTMVDLGAVLKPWLVADCLERGLTEKLFSLKAVDSERIRLSRRGRRGAGVIREVMDERALGSTPADGLLEVRMAALMRDFGLPQAEFQYAIGPYRVDFAYPPLRIIIEVDGWEAHQTRRALQRDLERQNALIALGWKVLRFTWEDVVRRPSKVAAQIRAALAAAAA